MKKTCNSIYIIGAPSAAKHALVQILIEHFQLRVPFRPLSVIQDILRSLTSDVHPDDIELYISEDRDFARRFLRHQAHEEHDAEGTLLVADSSGIDPIIMAFMYNETEDMERLAMTKDWSYLRKRMSDALIFVCEPAGDHPKVKSMLMPGPKKEWTRMHGAYIQMLRECAIEHHVLAAGNHLVQWMNEVLGCYDDTLQ